MTQATWSKQVRARDGNKCFVCGSTEGLCAHHLLPAKTWPERRFDIEVGITLCKRHHALGRESVHRGCGAFLVLEKMRKERPEQFKRLNMLIEKELSNVKTDR